MIDEITPDNLVKNINNTATRIEKTNLIDQTILVNKTHREETKLLGKQSDESTVDLYRSKRPSNLHWQFDGNDQSGR